MWIASAYGFFSIVKKDKIFMVRARDEKDLNLLKRATGIKKKVSVSDHTDYYSRLILDADELELVKEALFKSITYPNFKHEIGELSSQKKKLPYYTRVWNIMYEFQEKLLNREPSWMQEYYDQKDAKNNFKASK